MPLHTATAPAKKPVELVALKEHLRVDGVLEDAILDMYLGAAVAWVEDYTRRPLVNRTLKLTLDEFPVDGEIVLPTPTVSAVSSVKYYDEDGTLQTLSTSDYWTVLDEENGPGRVILKSTASWPDTQEDRPRAVEVTFVAGYGADSDSVPDEIRHAVLLLAAHLFETRVPVITGTIVTQVPFSIEALLQFRRFYYFA